ncbi:MAG TPA: FtsW/RodA/SpoVE family cell cycle protein [Draconibacterium sp.]|nr:FtsW/RodA/SpoVE family cell cycle protein [Draconibacterium sp.]HRX12470.1 FtsW/RodA/SpoVE family cell cycle protein [Draconibacterium sp.]
METSILKYFKGDRVIWIVLMFLSLLSLLIVYSATGALAYRVHGGNTMHYLIRQVFFIGAGLGVILLMVNVLPVKFYSIAANYLLYGSILLLMAAVVLKFAGVLKGTGRTFNLGIFSFQPAELAKIALILFTAKVLGKKQKTNQDLSAAFRKIMIFTALVCGLILLSNFSTSALIFATIISMMFVGRIPIRYMLLVFATGIALLFAIYKLADFVPDSVGRIHTIQGRIDRFIHGDPNSEQGVTQADYAKLAIYSGGIFGKGPGQSDVSNYMAAAYNDFIFAIIVEEYGLIFGAGVIFLYLIFFFRGIIIVRKSKRTFPAFVVIGLSLVMVYQAMINVGVSSGVLPVTGQPLPWISLGGTSLLFTSIAFGCILSVSHQNEIDSEAELQPIQVNAPDEDEEMKK